MSKGNIALAIQRQQDRPDIHSPFKKPKGKEGYSENVFAMVRDLKDHVPGISSRHLSVVVGIGTKQIRKAIAANTAPTERWVVKDNESATLRELSALREAHPDCHYEDHPDAIGEYPAKPALFTAPQHRDPYRPAYQPAKRPITLPTFPFIPLPERLYV